jgi:3',5'-nucleoside bisphosphate phosphatase
MDTYFSATYDLHLHTYWSYDATTHPECYFKYARERGVHCIAITDHHVLDSLKDVLAIASNYPDVRAIPSAELTVSTSVGSVDLLCYGFQEQRSPELTKVLNMYHDWQRAAGGAISKGMQALGHDFSDSYRLQLLQSYRPPEAIDVQGNTHVKNAFLRDYFVERGFISKAEEYGDLMSRVQEHTLFPPYPDVASVVPVVKEAGAVVAIAHPFAYFNKYDIQRMNLLREECSLDGIECAHASVPGEYTTRYRDYCTQHGLFSVGGSDCHSDNIAHNSFARHAGKDEWLDEFLACLDNK